MNFSGEKLENHHEAVTLYSSIQWYDCCKASFTYRDVTSFVSLKCDDDTAPLWFDGEMTA